MSEEELSRFSVVQSTTIHTGTDADIRTVTDGNSLFILKQINDSSLEEQFLLVNDCIASTIGFELGVPVNQVFFIPYDAGTHLKKYPERAATLHCIVPGKDLEFTLPNTLALNFSLHQKVINPNSPWQKKYPLLDNQQGLTQLVIESMCEHSSLCAIAAFDSFIGNSDRSNPNLFYDVQNNSFYGIDHAAAFSKKLPFFACKRLEELKNDRYFVHCCPEVIARLKEYRNVLRKLYDSVEPSTIIQAMHNLSSYLVSDALANPPIIERMQYHHQVIESNYCNTRELLKLLDQLHIL